MSEGLATELATELAKQLATELAAGLLQEVQWTQRVVTSRSLVPLPSGDAGNIGTYL